MANQANYNVVIYNIIVSKVAPTLKDYVNKVMEKHFGEGWEDMVDVWSKSPNKADDPYFLLNVINRYWADVFESTGLSRSVRSYVNELKEARNRIAHNDSLSQKEALRVLDTTSLLLSAVGAEDEALYVEGIRKRISAQEGHSSVDSTKEGFSKALLNRVEEIKRNCNYYPKFLVSMIERFGAYNAICYIMKDTKINPGLLNLYKRGCIDLSIESLVLQDSWRKIFPDYVINNAEEKLRKLKSGNFS